MRTRAEVARPHPARTNRTAWWLLAAALSIVMTLSTQMSMRDAAGITPAAKIRFDCCVQVPATFEAAIPVATRG